MRMLTVRQLGEYLMEMPGDSVVMIYGQCDEGLDLPDKPRAFNSPAEVDEAFYCKGHGAVDILGTLVDCEPGTGQYGKNKDKKFVPYTGPVVVI